MYVIVAVVTGPELVWELESVLLWVFRLTKSVFLLVSGRHIWVPQKDTHMASTYKTLQIWVKHFSKYLERKEVHKAENCMARMFAWVFCFPAWIPNFIHWTFRFLFLMASQWNTSQLKSCGEAGKGWVLLTSLSLSPIGIHVFLGSKNDIFRYHTGIHFSDFVIFLNTLFFFCIFKRLEFLSCDSFSHYSVTC